MFLNVALVSVMLVHCFIDINFVSDKIKPSDVGLEQEAQLVRGFTGCVNQPSGWESSLPPIRYIHIYECDSFSVRVTLAANTLRH